MKAISLSNSIQRIKLATATSTSILIVLSQTQPVLSAGSCKQPLRIGIAAVARQGQYLVPLAAAPTRIRTPTTRAAEATSQATYSVSTLHKKSVQHGIVK